MKKGRFTDLLQLIVISFFTIIDLYVLSLPLFERISDERLFSFYSMLKNLNVIGLIIFSVYFILTLVIIVMSFIQSRFIHKKKWFCFAKEICVIIQYLMFNISVMNINGLVNGEVYRTLSINLIMTLAFAYPIFLYICDYLEAIIQAE